MSLPLFKLSEAVALLAGAHLLALAVDRVANPGRAAALRADELNLAGIERAFRLNQAAGLAHLAGFHMLGNNVNALDDDLALSGANL